MIIVRPEHGLTVPRHIDALPAVRCSVQSTERRETRAILRGYPFVRVRAGLRDSQGVVHAPEHLGQTGPSNFRGSLNSRFFIPSALQACKQSRSRIAQTLHLLRSLLVHGSHHDRSQTEACSKNQTTRFTA